MRYRDLCVKVSESIGDSNVKDMIWTIILSLSSSGVSTIPVDSINTELNNQLNMNLSFDELKGILESIPSVQVVDDEFITLNSDSEDSTGAENSKDAVAAMAKAPAERTF